ncbi:MAG: hypothetical protein J6A48_11095, partial [Clostridia bacterium]|nr:hypothetical protein [Clostridia bacterium]
SIARISEILKDSLEYSSVPSLSQKIALFISFSLSCALSGLCYHSTGKQTSHSNRCGLFADYSASLGTAVAK